MRKSTIILSTALIMILGAGFTAVKWYAPKTSGETGQLLTAGGPNTDPVWLSNGTSRDILTSGGANAAPEWKGLETATITRESTSSGGITVRKIGRFCTISVNQLASTAGGGGTAAPVGTISGTNYLPTDDYFGVSITPINGGTSAYLLIRNESSTMKIYLKGHVSGTKYYGSGFYITK